jgi:hypothetical protein
MTRTMVPGFLPSTAGFRFANSFPHVPLRRIGVPGLVSVPIGDASNGLCGGMAFAARDYFQAGRPPPAEDVPPSEGPLYEYLVRRLFDSFGLPLGPVRYLELMHPALSDGETFLSLLRLAPHGRTWRLVREEWPRIRADIDAGRPCPLGLVRVKSTDPFDLKENHQVLAYGYDVEGPWVTLLVYDPNLPGRDDATISFDTGSSTRPVAVSTSPVGRSVYAVFAVPYHPTPPP